MGRPLVQHNVCIDLPGEAVSCRAETDLTVLLRKHRDVVFDIKLHAGATYTVTTTHPDRPTGRFYDTKRKVNTGETTFKDGESCHIWIGRNFEGSLILKQGEKEMGRLPISKMDCTKGCTDDPKDKPAPILIRIHDDQSIAKSMNGLSQAVQVPETPEPSKMTQSIRSVRGLDALSGDGMQIASAPVPFSEAQATRQRDVLPTLHAFKIKQTSGSLVPPELVEFFSSGSIAYKWDPLHTISRNFLLAQVAGWGGYYRDSFGPNGPLRGFFKRLFVIVRNNSGEFMLYFQTSKQEQKLLGFLLTTYRARSDDVRVMTLVGGAGSMSATTRASWEAANASVNLKTMTGKAMGFAIIMDTIAWLDDKEKDRLDLLVTIGLDVFQMWLATYAATAFLAVFFAGVATAVAGAVTAPVWVIAIGALVVISSVNYIVGAPFNYKNKKDGKRIADYVAAAIREMGATLEKDQPRDYPETYSHPGWQVSWEGVMP